MCLVYHRPESLLCMHFSLVLFCALVPLGFSLISLIQFSFVVLFQSLLTGENPSCACIHFSSFGPNKKRFQSLLPGLFQFVLFQSLLTGENPCCACIHFSSFFAGSRTTFAAESRQIRKNLTFSTFQGLNLCTIHILIIGWLRGQDVFGS